MEKSNEINEELIKKDIKKIEKLWKDIEDDYSLEYHLNKMTKDELVKIASNYSVRGVASAKKADAILKVKNGIVDNISHVVKSLDNSAFTYLNETIKLDCKREYKEDELLVAKYLRNRGLAFTGKYNDVLSVIVPRELCDTIELQLTKENEKNSILNSEIIKVVAGLTYFYGTFNLSDICSLVKERYNYNLDINTIKNLILSGEELGFDYVIDNNIVSYIDVDDVDFISEKRDENTDINFVKFDKKTLIKASKVDYIEENKQAEKLQKVLGDLFIIDKEILKRDIESFFIAIKNEEDMNDVIEEFLSVFQIESKEERTILVAELERLAKSIRRWTLKGHSQSEIENKKNTVINNNVIGRNEPCSCGSNKKYKKCCGK